jgi:hypothetical protein
MRSAKETAEIVEQVVEWVHSERAKRRSLGMDTSYSRVVYSACRVFNCLRLFEYILFVVEGRSDKARLESEIKNRRSYE